MADLYGMDNHKMIYHMPRIMDWQEGKRIAPVYIDMGITQTCNIGCQYCYYSVPENRTSAKIPTDALIRFLNEAAEIGVKAIGFLGDGEPMVHPGVYDAVIAGSKAGLDMSISTNGVIMKEDRLKDFLDALVWIRFNISAVTHDKYELVMQTKPKNLDKVVANIKKCVAIKKKYNLKTTIGLQMVLIEECADQIVPFAKFGQEMGVDYAVIKQCSEAVKYDLNLTNNDYSKYESLLKEAETYTTDDYNVIVKWKKMMNNERKYNTCYGCEFLPQIAGNGDVYTCGNFFTNKKFHIGNIVNQSFKEIIYGERYRKVMDEVQKVDVHKACGMKCRQNEINEFLWKLKNPPQHINFI